MINKTKIDPKLIYLILGVSIVAVIIVKLFFIKTIKNPSYDLMKNSVVNTKACFEIINKEKEKMDIHSDAVSLVKYKGLLGNDFSEITTTLGSLESKELTTNPEFAAVITKLLIEKKINAESTVGVMMSASFPALSISTIVSLQTLGAKIILFSSLGSSTYGANQPSATWADIENWLFQSGILKHKSDVVSLGGENDRGEGLLEEGIELLIQSGKRNNINIYMPNSLDESIKYKTNYLLEGNIDLAINLGGNQATLGACSHASTIPNGYNKYFKTCNDEERGILIRLNENGIPFINFLNIKDLALKYGVPLQPGSTYGDCSNIYYIDSVNKVFVLLITIILVFVFGISIYVSKNKMFV